MNFLRLVLLTSLVPVGVSLAEPLLVPADDPPSVLAQIEVGPDVRAVDVGPQGRRAALATSVGEGKRARSTVRVVTPGQADRSVELAGIVRDLLFSRDGTELFVIQLRPATKRRALENYLLRLSLDTLKTTRDVYLPATARGLGHWPARDALLIPCRNEVRSLLLPDMRSGPLFRILGENFSVATIDGSRVVVGQRGRLLVVDLSDRPGHEEMPTREAIDIESTVLEIAVESDEGRGRARLDDGRIVRFATNPLAVEGAVAAPPVPAPPEIAAAPEIERTPVEVEPPPPAPEPPPVEDVPAPAAAAEIETTPVDVEPPPPAPLPPPVEDVPALAAAPEIETTPDEVEPPPPAPEPPPVEDVPAPAAAAKVETEPVEVEPAAPTAVAAGPPQIRGTISGPEAERVVAVVFFGPNNILREATRVLPRPGGDWEVRGLEPGRYRVLVDAGGGRVLLTEPRFRMVDVESGAGPISADFKIVRSL